ncbi:MAG: MarR family transcriptional regulator [Desulfobacterota bacterium]|nr:MarR family transcriptional regulator [Thermodesulfobacteriota bacterium]
MMYQEPGMEKKFVEYLAVLRDFGRIYTGKIISETPSLGTDLKLSQIRALYAFRDRNIMTMRELADSVGVKMPTMTIMVDCLVKDGIVERERDEHDRRKVNVWLTDKGKKIRSTFLEKRHRVARMIFERVQPNDQKELLRSLESVCTILRRAFEQDEKRPRRHTRATRTALKKP